jgi:phosphatidylserine/phosphatidylglycerophosphate/cardiolipin synthase-like enzyme
MIGKEERIGMIIEEPPFYGTWKGRVLEAIAVENIRDWVGILEFTQLTRENLNAAISELYRLDVIERKEDDGLYWIKDVVLVHQYRSYFEFDSTDDYDAPLIQHEEEKEITLEKALPKDENLANFVVKWRAFKNLSFSLDARHFFLEGTYLDDLSKDLIRQARKEVLLVNPFVEECHLSNTLIDAVANKAKVTVITRNPLEDKHDFRQDVIKEKHDYLETLQNEGITIHYDRRIHAKLLVVDEQIAVISSMNFYSTSSGGSSWEAGMISVDDAIVSSVHATIHQLLKKF